MFTVIPIFRDYGLSMQPSSLWNIKQKSGDIMLNRRKAIGEPCNEKITMEKKINNALRQKVYQFIV